MIKQHLYLEDSNSVVTFIQKNACTAINASVAVANGTVPSADKFNWGIVGQVNHATPEQIENADYRFVFLRDPLKRLMSAFYDQVITKKPPHRKINIDLDFDSFVSYLDQHEALRLDIHWTPQADFLLPDYDAMFDIGNLEYANNQLKSAINFQVADIRGMYGYATKQYPTECIPETKSLVKKLYAVDYLLYEGVNHGGA